MSPLFDSWAFLLSWVPEHADRRRVRGVLNVWWRTKLWATSLKYDTNEKCNTPPPDRLMHNSAPEEVFLFWYFHWTAALCWPFKWRRASPYPKRTRNQFFFWFFFPLQRFDWQQENVKSGGYLEPKVINLQSEHLTQPAKIAPRWVKHRKVQK